MFKCSNINAWYVVKEKKEMGRLITSYPFLIGGDYMAETKRLAGINRTVYLTEEFSKLKEVTERAGEKIVSK